MVAQRTREVEISGIRKMFESAPPNSINLGLGEPDFDPPAVVVEALCKAARGGRNHYGPSSGIPELRDKIAERYRELDPGTMRDNVIVTAGGSEGLMTAALALYDPGTEVLVPNPGFVLYGPHARLAGAQPVPYSLRPVHKYLPDFDELEQLVSPRTVAIAVNSPSNPTGAVFPRSVVDRLVAFADRHNLTILSDEVYEEIVYGTTATSFWGRSDRVVIANSFSKTLAVTGWRLGFMVAPKTLAATLNKIHYHIIACPSTPAQLAVLAGLEAGTKATQAMVKEFRARRELVTRLLGRVPGLSLVPPQGAFYAFPHFSWNRSAPEVAQALLSRGVITTPGDAFGTLGSAHLRISFAASRKAISSGLKILHDYAEEVAE